MLRRGGSSELTDLRLIREQLVLIWNARGAADIAALEAELLNEGTAMSGLAKNLDRALRGLDR